MGRHRKTQSAYEDYKAMLNLAHREAVAHMPRKARPNDIKMWFVLTELRERYKAAYHAYNSLGGDI